MCKKKIVFTLTIIADSKRINIDQPLWNQDTFTGRFKHFAFTTDPSTCLTSEDDLDKAKALVDQYRYLFINRL